MKEQYYDAIMNHYTCNWKHEPKIYIWDEGPFENIGPFFRVLEFQPTVERAMWAYATLGMSNEGDIEPIELHLFSSNRDENLIELLTTVAYFHRADSLLGLGHTMNFGRPWRVGSNCTYGLISLPYLDGLDLEDLPIENNIVKFYWLIPITEAEVKYKQTHGLEALEAKFEEVGLNYIDVARPSIVGKE